MNGHKNKLTINENKKQLYKKKVNVNIWIFNLCFIELDFNSFIDLKFGISLIGNQDSKR